MSEQTVSTFNDFRIIRESVNKRLMAQGLPAARVPDANALEGAGVTQEDIDRLKADLAQLIQLEGRRSFWSGVWVNAIFFVLGLITPAAITVVNGGMLPW